MSLLKVKPTSVSKLSIGINERARKQLAQLLSQALAETYVLQVRTQYYHWNITGPQFGSLHPLLGTQYDELAVAVDELAERIRALGETSPGTLRDFLALSTLKEDKSLPASWEEMVKNLVAGHEAAACNLRPWVGAAQEAGDEGTADLFIGRLQAHEKAAWMLRSHLQ